MSIIALNPNPKRPQRGPPTTPLSRTDAERIQAGMPSDANRRRRTNESVHNDGKQNARTNCLVGRFKGLLCCCGVGKTKYNSDPVLLSQQDRAPTFGQKMARRLTSLFKNGQTSK